VTALLVALSPHFDHVFQQNFAFSTQFSNLQPSQKPSQTSPHFHTRCIPPCTYAQHFSLTFSLYPPFVSSFRTLANLPNLYPRHPPPSRSTRTVPYRTTLNIIPHVQGSSSVHAGKHVKRVNNSRSRYYFYFLGLVSAFPVTLRLLPSHPRDRITISSSNWPAALVFRWDQLPFGQIVSPGAIQTASQSAKAPSQAGKGKGAGRALPTSQIVTSRTIRTSPFVPLRRGWYED
jgi:hypothetical protein